MVVQKPAYQRRAVQQCGMGTSHPARPTLWVSMLLVLLVACSPMTGQPIAETTPSGQGSTSRPTARVASPTRPSTRTPLPTGTPTLTPDLYHPAPGVTIDRNVYRALTAQLPPDNASLLYLVSKESAQNTWVQEIHQFNLIEQKEYLVATLQCDCRIVALIS